MSGILLQNGKQAFTDANGHPLAGGRVFFYSPNTSTPKDTWQDAAETILNTNPIILDARGEASIYGSGSYRQVLTDASLVQIWDQFIPDLVGSVQDAVTDLFSKSQVQVANIAALKLLDPVIYKNAATLGYLSIGDGGDGRYYFDPLDTTSADNGGTVIIGLSNSRWKLIYNESVCIEQFGALPIVARNNFANIQAAVVFCYTNKVRLTAGDGVFEYGTVLDLSYPMLNFAGAGMDNTILKFTGVGRAADAIGTRPNNGAFSFGFTMADLCIMGSATATDLLRIRINHCRLTNINLKEAATSNGCGLRVQGCILPTFDNVVCSTNHQLMTSRPQNGIVIEADPTDGRRATAVTFINPIIEGMTGDGIANQAGDQVVIIGGTSENNGGNGITQASSTRNNTCFGTSFETNSGFSDIFEGGVSNKYINCASTRLAYIDNSSMFAEINGGIFELITVGSGAAFPSIEDVKVRFFTGLSTGVGYSGNQTVSSRNIYDVVAAAPIYPKVAAAAITVGASPFAHRNFTGKQQTVIITGGTVTQVVYTRDTAAVANVQLSGTYVLQPGDGLTVSYSVLPTMTSVIGGTNYN